MGRLKKAADLLDGHVSKEEKEKRREMESKTKVGTDALEAPPSFLTGEARREFLRVTTECRAAGILDNLDVTILAIYAEAWANYTKLGKLINKTGSVIVKRRVTGKTEIYPNPAVTAQTEYANRILKCSTKLGLATSDRLRLVVPKEEKPANKFARFAALE